MTITSLPSYFARKASLSFLCCSFRSLRFSTVGPASVFTPRFLHPSTHTPINVTAKRVFSISSSRFRKCFISAFTPRLLPWSREVRGLYHHRETNLKEMGQRKTKNPRELLHSRGLFK